VYHRDQYAKKLLKQLLQPCQICDIIEATSQHHEDCGVILTLLLRIGQHVGLMMCNTSP
jgi:hypothetical protein